MSCWTTFPSAPIPDRGEAVPLSAASTAQALVAFLAGPRFVQRVPREHEVVREQQDDGPWTTRPVSDVEKAEVQADLAAFFEALGLPAPPSSDEWALHLPPEVSVCDFHAAVNDPTIPVSTDSNGQEVMAAVRDRVEALLTIAN